MLFEVLRWGESIENKKASSREASFTRDREESKILDSGKHAKKHQLDEIE